jgi:hypothetical protein
MTISMSKASLPVLSLMLNNTHHILSKAQNFIDQTKCDPSAITQYRLAPDMFPFARQIIIACDMAKNGMARLSGVEAPKFEDNESSIAELQTRIQKTLDYLATIPADQIDGSEQKDIIFPVGPNTMTMQGLAYLNTWLLPNFYFHITTAYLILRHNGVDLGKRDYLVGANSRL